MALIFAENAEIRFWPSYVGRVVMPSGLEMLLAFQIRAKGLTKPQTEFAAIPGRRYRFDFAWGHPGLGNRGLLVEVQGATWIKGAHSTGQGINRDCEKSILAQLLGWRVFQVTRDQIESGQAIQWIEEALNQK